MSTPPAMYPEYYPPRRPSAWGAVFRFMMGTLFGISVGLNLLVLFVIVSFSMMQPSNVEDVPLRERIHSGDRSSSNKIAIIEIDGVIIEGLLDFARRQIDRAGRDRNVKAVVVRINSPGGSITASDDLFHRLTQLRDGDADKDWTSKPLVVSMGSIAASGGYYIAMPAKHIVAERTTITGSIGVYAAFPNVKELADKWGVKMNVIKRGEVKDSGSMFHDMTPQERHLWQDLIDNAYDQFLAVVREGRGDRLKTGLRDTITVKPAVDGEGPEKEEYVRRLADGGVFTADKAQQYGLVDQIGYLNDAIVVAVKQAGVGNDYKAVTYDRPRSFLQQLIGIEASTNALDVSRWSGGAMPRIWYLTPESGVAGFLAASGSR